MGEEEEREEVFDADEILQDLMETHGRYFTDEAYRTPTTRYEAWLMASYLSNFRIAKALEKISERIEDVVGGLEPLLKGLELLLMDPEVFQKGEESPIIKKGKTREAPTLKRRKKG